MTIALATTNSLHAEGHQPDAAVRIAWKVKAVTVPSGPDITCVVVDVIPGGARLSVPSGVHLPERFSIYCPLKDETHRVEVKWRDGDASEIGIAFLDPKEVSGPAGQPGADARIAQLEAHIWHLEQQIHRMEGRIATLADRVARIELP